MSRKSLTFSLIALLTIVAVAGAFTSFQRKRSSFERLDFRFNWKNGIIRVDQVDPGSGAEASGLRAGDQIWVVGDTPSAEVEGLKKTLRRLGPVPLVVFRDGKTLTLRYVAPGLKIDYRYLFLTFIGFLYLAIGLFTLFRGKKSESSLFFFVTLLAFVVYVYSPAGQLDRTYKALWLIEEFSRIFLPPLALHFFLRFPRPLMTRRWTLAAIYFLPSILALWVIDLLLLGNAVAIAPPAVAFAAIDRWEMLHFAVYFTLAFIALTYTFRTASATGHKKQIKWIYLGTAGGFIPFLILYLIPFILKGPGSSTYTTAAILPLAFIPLAFAVSILKYKLWDVEVVIKEVVAYTVTFIFGMIAFSTVNILLSQFLEERLALERNFLAFASGLLIAGVLIPVKGRIESLIDMILYRDTYRHRRAIADFAQELATFRDLPELIEILRERLSAAIHLDRMNLYLRDGNILQIYEEETSVPTIIREDDFQGLLLTRKPLMLDHPRLPDASEVPMSLLRSGYRYVFPLRHRNELQGILICGTKSTDDALSSDDLHLVESLTAPVALAIENARLYGRLRRQLDQIRSLKEYNENIIESSSSGIVVVGPDGSVLTANQAFWDLIGREPILGSIEDLFPPHQELMQDGGRSEETTFVNHRGQVKEITMTASPFTAPDAPEGTTVIVIGDISDRIRLERELVEKERLASLGLLAAGVAHEVNTPLTGISSYAQLLLKDLDPADPSYAILKKMELQTFRASHLVNNLLDFAADRQSPRGPVNLEEMIRSTVELNEELFEAKRIRVAVEIRRKAVVMGGVTELEQVLTNLLLNARDAVTSGGNITIELDATLFEAILRVHDDGCGVPGELRNSIFKPLVTTRGARGGTGLGLAICERIVRGLGGEIRLEPTREKGATFSVVLPLLSSESSESELM